MQSLAARKTEVHDMIARRAYEIYKGRGREEGHELEDWARAESELLCNAPADFLQSRDLFTVDVGVGDFRAQDLEVSIEPERVTISGTRRPRGHTNTTGNQHSTEIFCVIELPVEVDSSKAVATLQSGVLEISIAKSEQAQCEPNQPIAA